MALTMTRTRNQTTLNRLAQRIADLHGELATIERLVLANAGGDHGAEALRQRHAQCELDRDALHRTLKQFDPDLDPTGIGPSDKWLSGYGKSPATRERNYVLALMQHA